MLIKECEKIFEIWGDRANETYRKRFDAFVAEERPTCPHVYDFTLGFRKVLQRKDFAEFRHDHRWDAACSELTRYFFTQDYWVEE